MYRSRVPKHVSLHALNVPEKEYMNDHLQDTPLSSQDFLAGKPLPVPTKWAQTSMAVERAKIFFQDHIDSRIPNWARISGWRATVTAGACVATVVLIINLVILCWSLTMPVDSTTQQRVLTAGNCQQSQTAFTWSHFAINVLSTLLLGSSNAAMQCLSAPTRDEVDEAHAKGKWVDIGISGFRNWSAMANWRRVCWVLLALSSLPLHLLYNSAVFSTTSGNEYYGLVVTENFLKNQTYEIPNVYLADGADLPTDDLVSTLRANATTGKLQRLENYECLQTYSQLLTSEYSNLLMISSSVNVTTSVLEVVHHYPTPRRGQQTSSMDPSPWMCSIDDYYGDFSPCDYNGIMKHASDWSIQTSSGSLPIDYCLVQPTEISCSVQVIPALMIIVVVCNAFKVLCFLYATRAHNFYPLITLGDALASFLARPDTHTNGYGAVSAHDIRAAEERLRFRRIVRKNKSLYEMIGGDEIPSQENDKLSLLLQLRPWAQTRSRWFSGASRARWGLTYALMSTLWVVGWTLFGISIPNSNTSGTTFADQWNNGFGNVSPQMLLETTSALSLFANILVANSPQVFISAAYLSYNGLFTCILLSREFSQYAAKRSGLRVTHPVGRYQRSTFYLSLPYRFSIPLLILAFLLHWFTSQSLFLAEVTIFSPYGEIDEAFSVNCLGYSPLSILCTVLVGFMMIASPLVLGWIRYDPRVPLVESCSIVMSAACHPPAEGPDEDLQLLKYGVPFGVEAEQSQPSLFSGRVSPLEPAQRYGSNQSNTPEVHEVDLALFQRHQRPVAILSELFNCLKMIMVPLALTSISSSYFGYSNLPADVSGGAFELSGCIMMYITIAYCFIRMIVDAVRWRKKWMERIFFWHVLPEVLLWFAFSQL